MRFAQPQATTLRLDDRMPVPPSICPKVFAIRQKDGPPGPFAQVVAMYIPTPGYGHRNGAYALPEIPEGRQRLHYDSTPV